MNLKISEMKKTLKLSEDTLFPVVQGGENMAITANDLLNNIDWLLKHNKCHNTCEADVEQYKYDALLCQIKTAVVNSKEAKADSMNALTIAESSSKVADNAYDAAISARKEVLDIMAKNKQVDKVVVDVTAVKAQSELTASELQKEIADRKAADEEIKTQIANISTNGNATEIQSEIDKIKQYIGSELRILNEEILATVESQYVKKTDIPATSDLSNYALKTELNSKQDTLVAGQNITITGNIISATQPDLSEYAKKAELPAGQDLSAYETKAHATATYQPIGNYLQPQDLSDLNTKVQTKLSINDAAGIYASISYLTSTFLSKQAADTKYQVKGNYLTSHQDISGKADKTSVYTKAESDGKYQLKGNYLTEHQDLSTYAKKTEIVQADWNETSATSNAFIKNKPTIPTIPTNVVVGTSQAYKIETVTALPTNPDANTIYLITE